MKRCQPQEMTGGPIFRVTIFPSCPATQAQQFDRIETYSHRLASARTGGEASFAQGLSGWRTMFLCESQRSRLQNLAPVWKALFSVSSILTACILGSLLDLVLQRVTIVNVSTSTISRRLESSIAFKCGWMETLHNSFQNKSAIWQNTLTQVPSPRKTKSLKNQRRIYMRQS